jgi:hypothetical protein
MVVGENDTGAPVRYCIGDDFAQREVGAILASVVAGYMQATCLLINVSDPQMLATRVFFGQTAGEVGLRGGEAVKFQRRFGTLITHRGTVRAAAPQGLA